MTRTTLFIIVTLLLGLASSPALAAPKGRKGKPAKTLVAANATCESTGSTTKRCFVSADSAELHLQISKAYPVIVTLDELPNFTYADPYIAHQVTEEFVLFKLRGDKLPKGHNLILRTETMTLTLFFHVVKKGADSQVHILRSDRASQNASVERRVAEKVADLEAVHEARLAKLEERAKTLARKQFLQQVHFEGSQVGSPAGEVRAREDFLVLRASRVVRIGKERILIISIEERKGDVFSIGSFEASVKQKGTKRRLDVDFRCSRMVVRPGKTETCTLSLGEIDKRQGRAQVSLKVAGADGERTVHLNSVNIL